MDRGLPLSLNTDDPGLFFSSLPGEFAAMYGALSTEMSHRETLRWLEERVHDARRSSFLGLHVPVGVDSPVLWKRDFRELMRFVSG